MPLHFHKTGEHAVFVCKRASDLKLIFNTYAVCCSQRRESPDNKSFCDIRKLKGGVSDDRKEFNLLVLREDLARTRPWANGLLATYIYRIQLAAPH